MRIKATINSRGVITIPAKLRERFGLKADDELILEDTGQGILIRPSISVPIELYTDERIAEFTADEDAVAKRLGSAPKQ